MQSFVFDKMHGAGNDFVVTHDPACPLDKKSVELICDRKFGIGSDGLIVLSGEAVQHPHRRSRHICMMNLV